MLFDEIVLLVYILTMIIILIFASHGIIMLFYHRKYIENIPKSNADFNYDKKVTIQLPLYNEKYVAERLIETVCKIDYPRELLEIQVLDDSTDDTKNLVNKIVKEKKEIQPQIEKENEQELKEKYKFPLKLTSIIITGVGVAGIGVSARCSSVST